MALEFSRFPLLRMVRPQQMPTSNLIKIAGGIVYDPANGIDGKVRDIWIDGGRIIAAPSDPKTQPAKTLDAAGLVVMPGGVDMHCHIAGPKVNAARRMRPEENGRSTTCFPRGRRSPAGAERRVCAAARSAARPAPLPLAINTPASATPRLSTPRSRRSRPGMPTGICRHAVHRSRLLHSDGQQPLSDAGDWPR